jgi:hypothetical protein
MNLTFDDLIPASRSGNAISGIESGGRYDAVGPETGKGRALGKYQVMESNVPSWSEEALGRRLTPQQFLADPEAQETVFKHKFGQYEKKYGPEGAARAWFAGEGGMNNPNAKDILGTSVADYSRKFTKAYGKSDDNEFSSRNSLSFDDLIPQSPPAPTGDTFADRFAGDKSNPGLTQAPSTSSLQRVAIDFLNQGPAAGQKTTADVSQQKLLSDAVHEGDDGFAYFRDASGKMVQADSAKHVVLTDPADNRLKVYERTDQSNRNTVESLGRLVATGAAANAPAARGAAAAPAIAKAPTEGQQVAAAAERVGVDLPRAVTSDNLGVQWSGKAASNVPIAGVPIRRAAERAIGQMEGALDVARAGYGSANPATAGQAVREGVTEAIKSGPIKQKVDELYTAVDGLVNPVVTGPLMNTRKIANEIASRRTTSALPGSKNVDELDEALNRGGLTYEGVKGLRSHFGEMLHGAKEIPQGMSQAEVKQIYGALSQDMRLTIARAGGQQGLAAYDKAEKAAKRWANVREDLQRVLNVQNEEGIFAKVLQAASSRSTADVKLLGRVRGAVGPDKWNEVSAALIEKLGKAPDGTFSPDRMLGQSGLGGLSPEGKRLLFRSTGQNSHADVVDDIAAISQRWKSLNQFANPSGSGQQATAAGMVAWAFSEPVTFVTAAVGSAGAAKILATPSSARSMAAWSRAYERAVVNPTKASVEGFRQASKLFATNVSREIGLPAESLTKNLQGAIPVGAENERN